MCDWDEAEYAEYVLWVEAAHVRFRAALATPVRERARSELSTPETPPIAIEA